MNTVTGANFITYLPPLPASAQLDVCNNRFLANPLIIALFCTRHAERNINLGRAILGNWFFIELATDITHNYVSNISHEFWNWSSCEHYAESPALCTKLAKGQFWDKVVLNCCANVVRKIINWHYEIVDWVAVVNNRNIENLKTVPGVTSLIRGFKQSYFSIRLITNKVSFL